MSTGQSFSEADVVFDTFDAEGAGNALNQGTYPQSINAAGAITGYYLDAGLSYHGFLRLPDGTMVTIGAPGTGSGQYQGTRPVGINSLGAIAGYYIDSVGVTGGFIRAPDGAFAPFALSKSSDPFTIPNGLNDHGTVVGSTNDSSGVGVGFVRTADGHVTTFDFPSQAFGVNSAGTIIGTWGDALRGVSGVFVCKESGSPIRHSVLGVLLAAINDAGTIMGTYAAEQTHRGFLLAADGTVIPFDGPDTGPSGTTTSAVNTDGIITGYYVDTKNTNHGFLRSPNGVITSFDVPHTAGSYGTFATGINAAATVTGYYYDPNMAAHGFVRRRVR